MGTFQWPLDPRSLERIASNSVGPLRVNGHANSVSASERSPERIAIARGYGFHLSKVHASMSWRSSVRRSA